LRVNELIYIGKNDANIKNGGGEQLNAWQQNQPKLLKTRCKY